jgi:aspartyl protease family protein
MLLRKFLLSVSLIFSTGASSAADVGVVGLFPGKAVLVVNGGAPKTYSTGTVVSDNIKLVAVTSSAATLEINGKRQAISIGEHVNRTAPSGPASVTLQPDGRGHYMVQGQINGGIVRMLLDTGATMIALPATDAVRLGIDYRKGQPGMVNTANGPAPVYRVTLNTVKVGDIELNQVEALVQETGLSIVLLGMSFLNRTEMLRQGEQMTLTKRF